MLHTSFTITDDGDRACMDIIRGKTIRALRTYLEISQDALAASASVSKRTVEALENAKAAPKRSTIRSIAQALGADEILLIDPQSAGRIIAVQMIAPMTTVDLVNIFEGVSVADVATPEETDPLISAQLRDVSSLYEQLVATFGEIALSDRTTYFRLFMQERQTLFQQGWVVRCGRYDRRVEIGAGRDDDQDHQSETVGVMRILPARADRTTCFIRIPMNEKPVTSNLINV